MLTRDVDAFVSIARRIAPDFGAPCARAAFLVAPDGFAHAEQSSQDNRYMALAGSFDAAAASAQHRALQRALSQDVPVVCFPGDPDTPDAVFPNNVFGTAPGRLVVGRMRHPVRQREARRADIRGFFRDVVRYDEIDLSTQPHPCELTGALVIDRARGLGFCGLSERCDMAGASLMHAAFGLRATLAFDLAPGEYHTNVVFALLAGRVALYSPAGFADARVADALAALYAPHAVAVERREHAAFVCNAIALSPEAVWMSARADAALTPHTRTALREGGLQVRSIELGAVEAAGGSLRCCVGEIY